MTVGVAASILTASEWGKPTGAQRVAFDELKAIAAKVEQAVEMVESRVGAILAAVRTLRPG
jgi:hypothetical protein